MVSVLTWFIDGYQVIGYIISTAGIQIARLNNSRKFSLKSKLDIKMKNYVTLTGIWN